MVLGRYSQIGLQACAQPTEAARWPWLLVPVEASDETGARTNVAPVDDGIAVEDEGGRRALCERAQPGGRRSLPDARLGCGLGRVPGTRAPRAAAAQSTVAQATSKSRDRWGVMQLDHERLDVYDLALEFLVLANGIIEGLPRGRSHLADQFTRASLSIVLNLAEGAGKHSKLDKRRYYVTARGSATESAALLDVFQRLKLFDEAGHRAAKGMLVRLVSMLIKLAQSCEE